MALDALGREVKVSLDELKAALLEDIGQEKENAQKTDEATEQLKKLNANLEKIIGNDLDRELKALKKLIKKVSEVWEEGNNRRNSRRQAKEIGKAIAESMSGRGVDKTMTLGKALERSQRRFATAFGQIGKQFQKDFGSIGESIRNTINRMNPFKKMEKEGEAATSKFVASVREGWNKTTKFFQDNWQALTSKIASIQQGVINRISGWWNTAVSGVSKAWNTVTSAVGNAITKTIDSMAGVWGKYMTPLLQSAAKPFKWIGSYLAPIGKAIFGTVKDLFSIGKKRGTAAAQSDIGGMTGGPTKREMTGEGDPVRRGRGAPRVAGGQSDLCRCICRCIGKLLGVTKQGLGIAKKAHKDANQVGKTQINLDRQDTKLEQEQTDLQKKSFRLSDPRDQMIREEASRERFERKKQVWEGRGAAVRGGILRATSAMGQILASEAPAKDLAKTLATFAAKTAGFVASKPLEILGDILEKQEIFGTNLAGFGPILKFAGQALGGLAEGLLNLVLQPMAEEVGNFQDEMQAMYITRGSIAAGAGQFGDARNVLDTAKGVGNIAKKEEEFKRAAEEVTLTGQKYEKIQKQHLNNLRRGIRDEKQLLKVHHIGLRTASQIGANAEQTAEMFADWRQKLGASNIQLTQMERGMLSIARTTGVFGDRLVEAAKASQQFMEYMRMSGTFTAKAANNIIGLMAEAQKRGVSQGMSNVLQVLQGSLLGEGGDERSRNLAIAGIGGSERVRSRMMTGTILQDRGAQKIFAENLGSRLNQIARQRFGKDLDRLSIEEKGLLDPMIRQMFGKGVEELSQIIQTFKERSKNFSERMEELNQGTKRGLTEREVQNQRQQLIFDTGAEILEDFNRALQEEGGDIERAFAKIKRSSEDLKPFMDKFNIDMSRGGASIGDVLKKQAQEIRKRAEQQGLTADVTEALGTPEEQDARINEAMAKLAQGDRSNFQNLQAALTAIEGKTREQMRQNADPVTKIVTMLFKMEAYLRIISRSIINAIAPGVQDFMGHIEGVMDKAAVEFSKGTPEGRENAVKIIGEAIQKFPAEISKHTQAVTGVPGVSPAWQGLMGGIDTIFGEKGPIGMMIEKLGKVIKDNAKLIADAIDGLSKNIEEIIKQITKWGTILAVGGVLFVGIAGIIGLLVGGGGLIALLAGAGGLVAALGLLGAAVGAATLGVVAYAESTKADIRESRKVVDKASDQHKKATEKRIEETKDIVNRMSDEELRNKIKKANDELQRLGDISNKMSEDMAKNLGDIRTAPAALFGVHDTVADETTAAANEINKAQQALRKELQMLQKESLRRVTEGKTPEDIANEALKAQQKKQSIEKQQAEMWRKLNEATGAGPGAAVDVKQAMKRIPQIAAATGKTEEEIRSLLKEFKDEWFGKSAEELNLEARDALNRLISRSEPFKKLEEEKREATRTEFGTGDALKKSFEATKKSKKEFFMSEFGATIKDDKTKRILENYIDRFLAVQMSAAKELKVGDIKDVGAFKAPDELKDPEKYKKWRTEMEMFQAKMKELTGTTIDLNEVNKKMIEQTNKMRTADKAATDAAMKIFQSSKDIFKPGMKTYETTLGEKVVAKDYETAVAQAAKMGQKLEDRTKTEQRLIAGGFVAKDQQGKFMKSDADFERYAKTLATKVTEKQVQEFEITRQLLAEQDPEKRNKMYEVLHKKLLENINWDKMSWEDYEKAITQLATLEKAQQMFMEKAATPGSIYTHDVHLEKLLEKSPLVAPSASEIMGPPAPGVAAPAVDKTGPTAIPYLPNHVGNPEIERRQRNATLQTKESGDMSGVEANTGATAAATRAVVKVLGQIGRMLSKKLKSGDLGVSGPDGPMEAFFEEILNTEWPNARIGRKVGLEFDYTDIS